MTVKKTLAKYVRELVAALFWLYLILKLFFIDIDVELTGLLAPNYTWLLKFKFILFLSLLTLLILLVKKHDLFVWLFWIIFYPFIIIAFRIPRYILRQKSWTLVIALFESIISSIKSFRYTVIGLTAFLISTSLLLFSDNIFILWPSLIAVLIILLATYVVRFILVFKPSNTFRLLKKAFQGIRKVGVSSFSLDKQIKGLPVEQLSKDQLEKWKNNLQTSVIFNHLCLVIAKKLRDYQQSKIHVISSVLTWLLLIAFTTVTFAVINFGLYKIDPLVFKVSTPPRLFTFFYYSFYNLLFASIPEISPSGILAQIFSMVESFCALLLVVIFVVLLISIRSERYVAELNEVVSLIEREGTAMEEFILVEFQQDSMNSAVKKLEEFGANLMGFITRLSNMIRNP